MQTTAQIDNGQPTQCVASPGPAGCVCLLKPQSEGTFRFQMMSCSRGFMPSSAFGGRAQLAGAPCMGSKACAGAQHAWLHRCSHDLLLLVRCVRDLFTQPTTKAFGAGWPRGWGRPRSEAMCVLHPTIASLAVPWQASKTRHGWVQESQQGGHRVLSRFHRHPRSDLGPPTKKSGRSARHLHRQAAPAPIRRPPLWLGRLHGQRSPRAGSSSTPSMQHSGWEQSSCSRRRSEVGSAASWAASGSCLRWPAGSSTRTSSPCQVRCITLEGACGNPVGSVSREWFCMCCSKARGPHTAARLKLHGWLAAAAGAVLGLLGLEASSGPVAVRDTASGQAFCFELRERACGGLYFKVGRSCCTDGLQGSRQPEASRAGEAPRSI